MICRKCALVDLRFNGLRACAALQHLKPLPDPAAQVLRTPAPTGCELQEEEVWAHKPAAHQEEDQVGQRLFRGTRVGKEQYQQASSDVDMAEQ